MNERNFRYFMTVADERSISRAAQKLFISQPSLTQAIQRMEASLGLPLFKRTSNGLQLTSYGQQYYLAITQIHKIWNDFQFNLEEAKEMKSGKLTIGTPPSLGSTFLPCIIAAYNKKFPGIHCTILESSLNEAEENLINGFVDLSLVVLWENNATPQLDYHVICRDPYVVVTPANSPIHERKFAISEGPRGPVIDLGALKDQTFFLPMKGKKSSQIVYHTLTKANIIRPITSPSRVNQQLIQQLIAIGEGVAILPASYIHPDARLKIYQISPEYSAYWDICIAKLKQSAHNTIEDEFIRTAQAVFGKSRTEDLF